MEILAQEGTPWVYPERYSFNDNIIELRDRRDFGQSCQIIVDLFINGTEVSILNGKKRYHYAFGGPIILTDKYIYIPLFDSRKESKRIFHFWNYTYTSMGYFISRVSYNGDIEILSEKFVMVYLVKIKDNILYFKTKSEGSIKSIEIPSE
jgi:hypothetical protein